MTWARPEAWWLLLAAVPLVVLHLYFRRRRVVEVSSVRMWRELVGTGSGRRGLRWLREKLALALLLLALASLAGALADPVSGSAPPEPRRLVVVLDASVTMNTLAQRAAGEPPLTRFERARRAAADALERAGPEDDVTVWLASETPWVAVGPTTDAAAAARAVREAGDWLTLEPPALLRTLDLARRAVRLGTRAATIVVLTDEPSALALGPEALATRGGPGPAIDTVLGVVDAGAAPVDAGITLLARSPWQADTVEAVVTLHEGAPGPRSLVLDLGGLEVARVDVTDFGGTLRLPVPPSAEGVLTARLVPGDDFPENDRSGLVLRPRRPLRVVVTAPRASPSPFVVAALAVLAGDVDADATLLAAPDAPPGVLAAADLVVAEGALPAALDDDTPVLAFLGPGREPARTPLLWAARRGETIHPVLRGVDLAPLRIDAAAVLARVASSMRGGTVLVESAAGPLGVAGRTDETGARRVVFGFRPDATTLPLEAAFPLLVRNAIDWLRDDEQTPTALRAGDPFPLPGMSGAWGEDDAARAVRVADGGVRARVPLPAPGASRILRVRTQTGEVADTFVQWSRGAAPRATSGAGRDHPDAAAAIAGLADRHGMSDTRQRYAPVLAGAAVLFLLLGGALLGVGRARRGRISGPVRPAGRPALDAPIPLGSLTGDFPRPASLRS